MSEKKTVPVRAQFTLINVLILTFGAVISVLTFTLEQKLERSQVDLTNSKKIALDATKIKSSIAEGGDALKSLLIDPTNKPEEARKREADANLVTQFDDMAKIAQGDLAEPLAKLRAFAINTVKKQEDEIVGDLLAGRKDDAGFKYTINYFPIRKSLEKDVEAFASTAIHLDEERAQVISEQSTRVVRLVLVLQIVGVVILAVVLFRMMRTILQRLQHLADELDQTSQAIRGRSEGQLQAASELSQLMQDAAASLRSTASATQEVHRAVDNNAGLAEASKSLTAQGRQSAARGEKAVSDLLEAIRGVHAKNQELAGALEGSFEELSTIQTIIQNIETKTSAINQIVLQTRLLSFNASVEASRAGENGKGFAVVAEEVGKLAAMSLQASRAIDDLIRESSEQVEKTVSNISTRLDEVFRSSAAKIEEGTRSAEECGRIFQAIVTDVAAIDQRVGEIFESSQEQAKGVREIAVSVQQADNAINRNSARAQEGAEQTGEILSRAKQLDVVVGDIARVMFGENRNDRAG